MPAPTTPVYDPLWPFPKVISGYPLPDPVTPLNPEIKVVPMKYKDNMTPEELARFKAELQALEDAYASAAAQDALNPAPEGWEDPSDYVGMGWVDSRGRA